MLRHWTSVDVEVVVRSNPMWWWSWQETWWRRAAKFSSCIWHRFRASAFVSPSCSTRNWTRSGYFVDFRVQTHCFSLLAVLCFWSTVSLKTWTLSGTVFVVNSPVLVRRTATVMSSRWCLSFERHLSFTEQCFRTFLWPCQSTFLPTSVFVFSRERTKIFFFSITNSISTDPSVKKQPKVKREKKEPVVFRAIEPIRKEWTSKTAMVTANQKSGMNTPRSYDSVLTWRNCQLRSIFSEWGKLFSYCFWLKKKEEKTATHFYIYWAR